MMNDNRTNTASATAGTGTGAFSRRTFFMAAATLALAGALGLASCAAPASTGGDMTEGDNSMAATNAYAKITADDAKELMASGDPVIVDVRTPQEYAEGHIPGAINIPVETIGADKPAELSDTEAELIVYCRTGVRSKQASDKLIELGYQHVNDMGGIVDWTGEKVTGDQPGGM